MKSNHYRQTTAALVTISYHLIVLAVLYHLHLNCARPLPPVMEVEVVSMEIPSKEEIGIEGRSSHKVKEQRGNAPQLPNQFKSVTPPKIVASKPTTTSTKIYEESQRANKSSAFKDDDVQVDLTKQRRQEEEEARLTAELERKAEAARRANAKMASAFKGSAEGGGSTNATETDRGDKSSETSSSIGHGNHSLAGRSIVGNGGRLTMPTMRKAIRGRINIRILVDEAGKVIQADISLSGTNIADAETRAAVVAAARQTEFNPQPGAGLQRGIITYNFEIQ